MKESAGNLPVPEPPAELAPLDEAISQVLASRTFSRSEQMRRLLAHLRDASRTGDPALLTETAIGIHFFGRKDFNPKLDTIVRAEMLRLRRKLDEYYAGEDPVAGLRVGFERNSYRPILVLRTAPPPPEPAPAAPARSPFWLGAVAGAGLLALAWLAVSLLSLGASRPPAQVTTHPLWRRFQKAKVQVLLPAPLFWRTEHGFVRDFRLNVPADLANADNFLPNWPAHPSWDLWTPLESAVSAAALDNFLGRMGSQASFLPARSVSFGGLSAQHTIILGPPRMAPLLADLLADLDFRAPPLRPGASYSGFVNVSPLPGERPFYSSGGSNFLQNSDESMADYALITSSHLKDGGEVLSIFGDRVQTGGYVIRKLMDPQVLAGLNPRLSNASGRPWNRAQIVVRVEYNRGTPIGMTYVTHRIH